MKGVHKSPKTWSLMKLSKFEPFSDFFSGYSVAYAPAISPIGELGCAETLSGTSGTSSCDPEKSGKMDSSSVPPWHDVESTKVPSTKKHGRSVGNKELYIPSNLN